MHVLDRSGSEYILASGELDVNTSRPNELPGDEQQVLATAHMGAAVVDQILPLEEISTAFPSTTHRGYTNDFLRELGEIRIKPGTGITVVIAGSKPAVAVSGRFLGYTPQHRLALDIGERHIRSVSLEAIEPHSILRLVADSLALTTDGMVDRVGEDGSHTLGWYRGRSDKGLAYFQEWNVGQDPGTHAISGGRLVSLKRDVQEALLRRSDEFRKSDPPFLAKLVQGSRVELKAKKKTFRGYYLGIKQHELTPKGFSGAGGLDFPPANGEGRREIWIWSSDTGELLALPLAWFPAT